MLHSPCLRSMKFVGQTRFLRVQRLGKSYMVGSNSLGDRGGSPCSMWIALPVAIRKASRRNHAHLTTLMVCCWTQA